MSYIKYAGIIFSMLALSNTSIAGVVAAGEVTISTLNKTASGSLKAAAKSKDKIQFISCTVNSSDTALPTNNTVVFCFAKDANGVQASCSTQTPALIQAAMSISSTSYISFKWDEPLIPMCTNLTVTNGSQYY